jgi:hypothetical protein
MNKSCINCQQIKEHIAKKEHYHFCTLKSHKIKDVLDYFCDKYKYKNHKIKV